MRGKLARIKCLGAQSEAKPTNPLEIIVNLRRNRALYSDITAQNLILQSTNLVHAREIVTRILTVNQG